VAELVTQLEDFARRIDQRVDEQLDRLQTLLAEAEKKQEALRRQMEAATQSSSSSGGVSKGATGQVMALAAQGLDSVEIARRLKMDVGEVELMLNLHRSSVSPKA
jgi:DNA-nicking Smr family endonuclease